MRGGERERTRSGYQCETGCDWGVSTADRMEVKYVFAGSLKGALPSRDGCGWPEMLHNPTEGYKYSHP